LSLVVVLLVAEAKLGGGRSVSMEEEKMEEIERVFLGDGFTGFYLGVFSS
jgi:hypothetical protein